MNVYIYAEREKIFNNINNTFPALPCIYIMTEKEEEEEEEKPSATSSCMQAERKKRQIVKKKKHYTCPQRPWSSRVETS
jgi:hypothetical protein